MCYIKEIKMATLQELIDQKRQESSNEKNISLEDWKQKITDWGVETNFVGGVFGPIYKEMGAPLHEWLMTDLNVSNLLIYTGETECELHINWMKKFTDEVLEWEQKALAMANAFSQETPVPQPEPLPPEEA